MTYGRLILWCRRLIHDIGNTVIFVIVTLVAVLGIIFGATIIAANLVGIIIAVDIIVMIIAIVAVVIIVVAAVTIV